MKIQNYTPAIVVKQPIVSIRKTETRKVYRVGCFYWSKNILIIKIGFAGLRVIF
jgi:hypothetical protein